MTKSGLSPRAARTRASLVSAGMELLVERSVDAIAIDELVSVASVAKGSFFNHFTDKRQFARAVATEIRIEVEQWVAGINAEVSDPLERLANGMIATAAYALVKPQRTAVLARSFNGISLEDHPINSGLLRDLREASQARLVDFPSEQGGVFYWLGACQMLMGSIVESRADTSLTHRLLADMLQMSLRGLAAPEAQIHKVIESSMLQGKLALLREIKQS